MNKEQQVNKSFGSSNEQEGYPSENNSSSCTEGVKQCKNYLLKNRLHTLIISKGLSEPDFFNSLGFSRQYWYFISWGIWDTKPEDKIRIAEALNVDSSVIWQSADKTKKGDDNNGLLY